MNTSSYLLRIDDACPTMRRSSFERIRATCDSLGIRPLIGIVPNNQDVKLHAEPEWTDFWPLMQKVAMRGWIIAQHGYQHKYNMHKTEFAGLPYNEQLQKLLLGKEILECKLGIQPKWFMAPAHSLDAVTCKALQELSFTHITDGIAPYPFTQHGLIWVPQQLWRPAHMPFGVWTICLHPNTMNNSEIDRVILFMKIHAQQFKNVSFAPKKSLLTAPMKLAWKTALALKRI